MLQVKDGRGFQTHSPAVREDIRASVVAEAKRRDWSVSRCNINAALEARQLACEFNIVKC